MDMTAPNKAESAAKSEILEHVKSGLAHRRRGSVESRKTLQDIPVYTGTVTLKTY